MRSTARSWLVGGFLVAALGISCGGDADSLANAIDDVAESEVTPPEPGVTAPAATTATKTAPSTPPRSPETGFVQSTRSQPSMSPTLADEVTALMYVLGFPRVLVFPLLLGGAWLIGRACARVNALATRLGLRRRRAVAMTAAFVTMVAWVWALSLAMGRLLRAAPTVTLLVSGALLVVIGVGLSKHVENVAAGLGLALRRRIHEGDRVSIGDHHGVVRRVGFFRTQLRDDEGATIYVPNRLIAAEAVEVSAGRHGAPVALVIEAPRPLSPDEVSTVRQIAAVSPYRDVSSPPVVEVEGARVQIRMQVWSERAGAAAEMHLRRRLRRELWKT